MKRQWLVAATFGLAVPTVVAVSVPEVRAEALIVRNNSRSGPDSLAVVAALASTNGTADEITFLDTVVGTIVLEGNLTLGPGDSIVGPGSGALSIDGDGLYRPMTLSNAGTVSISGISFINGAAVDGGCLSATDTDLVLSDVAFDGCAASGNGGGVHIVGGSISMTVSNVLNNSAGNDGGGVWAENATVSISSTLVRGNTAGRDGGGLWSAEPPTIVSTDIDQNTATNGDGGGAWMGDGAAMVMRRCTVSDNTAGAGGGGLYVGSMQAQTVGLVASSLFHGNAAATYGGGMLLDVVDVTAFEATFTVVDSTVTANSAGFYGGIATFAEPDSPAMVVRFAFDTIVDNTAVDPQGQQLYVATRGFVTHSVVDGAGDAVDTSIVGLPVTRSVIGDTSSTFDGSISLDPFSTAHVGDIPGLGVLQDNGGPTLTMKPSAGSVLINNGASTLSGAPPYDARGAARKKGARYDIGAVEFQTPSAPRDVVAVARVDAVRVGWRAPLPAGDGAILAYRVYRQLADGSWTRVGTVGSAVRSYLVSGLVTGRLYRFRVAAVNAAGVGTVSASVGRRAG
jgi:hypothetical protein